MLSFQVAGVLIQGAVCTSPQGLAPLAADAPTLSPMPTLYLAWVSVQEREQEGLHSTFENPLITDLTLGEEWTARFGSSDAPRAPWNCCARRRREPRPPPPEGPRRPSIRASSSCRADTI